MFSMRMFTEEENGKVKISGLMKETVVEMYDLMGEGEEKMSDKELAKRFLNWLAVRKMLCQ